MKRIFLISLGMLISCKLTAASTDADLMNTWISLEQQTGSLKTNWNERKHTLKQQLELLKKEQVALEKIIEASNQQTHNVDKKRIELARDQKKYESIQINLTNDIELIKQYLLTSQHRLPTPLSSLWQEDLDLLSKISDNSKLLESITKLIKKANEFNNRFSLHTGLIQIDEKEIAVEQVYLGLSHGWYISKNNKYFGYGNSLGLQWQWWHGQQATDKLNDQNIKDKITKVINILKEPSTARYVQIPLSTLNNSKSKL